MGRIADALKKAEQERSERVRRGTAPASDPSALMEVCPPPPSCIPEPVVAQPAKIRHAIPTSWSVDPSVISITDTKSAAAQQYRAIRTWLLRRCAPGGRCAIAITSSVNGEGKSVTTANLAAAFAEMKHLKVLAVDADLRRGHLAKLLGTHGEMGLGEVLDGRASLADVILPTPAPNLHVLGAGNAEGMEPTALLSSPLATRAFEEIRERFHIVLVDTPPVQNLTDVGIIGGLCTGIAVVVRMNQTPSHIVRESVRWLQSQQLPVVGCIAAGCASEHEHGIDQVSSGLSALG